MKGIILKGLVFLRVLLPRMAGQHWSLVFVDFAIPVALDDELGRGVAEFESLRSLINGEFLLKDQLNELKPLLNGPKCTLSEM